MARIAIKPYSFEPDEEDTCGPGIMPASINFPKKTNRAGWQKKPSAGI